MRTQERGNRQKYEREGGKKVIVTFGGSGSGGGGSGDRVSVQDMPRDCAGARRLRIRADHTIRESRLPQ